MNIIKFIFSPAYRRGWNDARTKGFICNPYEERAIADNHDRGLVSSPQWTTEYRPFINWEDGQSDWAIDQWVKRRHPKHKKEGSQ